MKINIIVWICFAFDHMDVARAMALPTPARVFQKNQE